MKIGLIGCGGIGKVHNQALKALSEKLDIEVTAVADIRSDYAEDAAGLWSHAKTYKTGMDLINQSKADAVHICTPSFLHTETVAAAIRKGIAVLVEKPVCLTQEECTLLIETQKSFGTEVMVGHVVRFFDEYRYLKDVYDKKAYGALKSIVMHRISAAPAWGQGDWFHNTAKSGSVLLDLHIHDLDFLRYLLGEPDSITVSSAAFPNGMINQVFTNYRFKDVFAAAEGTWDISAGLPFEAYYRASFEEASVVYSSLHEPHLAVYHKDGRVILPKPYYNSEEMHETEGIHISGTDPYYAEISYFYDCLFNDKHIEIAPLSEGIASVRLALKEQNAIING